MLLNPHPLLPLAHSHQLSFSTEAAAVWHLYKGRHSHLRSLAGSQHLTCTSPQPAAHCHCLLSPLPTWLWPSRVQGMCHTRCCLQSGEDLCFPLLVRPWKRVRLLCCLLSGMCHTCCFLQLDEALCSPVLTAAVSCQRVCALSHACSPPQAFFSSDPSLLLCPSRSAQFLEAIHDAQPPHIAKLCWACAVCGYDDARMQEALVAHMLRVQPR